MKLALMLSYRVGRGSWLGWRATAEPHMRDDATSTLYPVIAPADGRPAKMSGHFSVPIG